MLNFPDVMFAMASTILLRIQARQSEGFLYNHTERNVENAYKSIKSVLSMVLKGCKDSENPQSQVTWLSDRILALSNADLDAENGT